MVEPTEDTPYTHIDDFAISDDDSLAVGDEDQTVETKLIQELIKYLDEAEVEHNSFDIIDLTEQAHMTPTEQIAVHKCVVQHLRNMKNTIKNKVKEN
jgi:hypothetical protein